MYLKWLISQPALLQQDHFLEANWINLTTPHGEYHQNNFKWLSGLCILWDILEPDSEKIVGNMELLPSISNPAALPYHDINGDESLTAKDIPGCLLPQKKYNAKDILSCFLCGEKNSLKGYAKTCWRTHTPYSSFIW